MAKRKRTPEENVQIQTPEFRAIYPSLFEARGMGDSPRKRFSVCMAFEPGTNIEPLKTQVRNVCISVFGPDRTKWPPLGDGSGMLKLPFRSGEEPGKKDKPGFGPGVIFADAGKPGEQMRPGIVQAWAGADGKPELVTVPSDIYSGCYMRACVNAYYWEYAGKVGVSFGLQSAQKLRDGEVISGGSSDPQEDFDAVAPPSASAGGPQPVALPAGDLGV